MTHRKKRNIAIAAVIAVLVIAYVWSLVRTLNGDDLAAYKGPRSEPLPSVTLPVPTGSPTTADTEQVEQALTAGGSSATFPLAGLQGGGTYWHLPRHQLKLTVTSSAPVGTVGYLVPTSTNDYYGVVHDVGQSWSLSTTVYGDPAYARLFIQAGLRGTPVTCTISVDGKVVERRSTEGPYGQMMCQG